jgi:pullulanase/glycogen debranching enzyme
MSVTLEQAVVEKMSPAANRADSTGRSYPLGATVFPDGINFSVFSRGASAVELLLFEREDDTRPTRVIPIDAAANRTYHYWHAGGPSRVGSEADISARGQRRYQ